MSEQAVPVAVEPSCDSPSLIITQIQAGLSGTLGIATSEFVELYNYGESPVAIDKCKITVSNSSGQSVLPISLRSGLFVQPGSYVLIINSDYFLSLAGQPFLIPEMISTYSGNVIRLGGIITISDEFGSQIITRVSPLTPSDPQATPALQTNQSLKRCVDGTGAYSRLGFDKDNFVILKDTSITNQYIFANGPECPWVEHDSEDEDLTEPTSPTNPQSTCKGVQITELLPNPAGSDGGKEFIELWNPTGAEISLNGCALQVTGSSKTYIFADGDILQPAEYRAFYDSTTGLTLPNSAGGKVWLIDASNQELQEVSYPANLADDVTWALFSDGWSLTFALTPGAPNIFMALKPCDTGLIRNIETNRCVTAVQLQSSLTPCLPGQERNPETNRCRSVVTTSASLTPCKEGQYRNPETNRCKSLETVSNTLVPCKENQERNPDTNRCRAVASANTLVPCKEGQERNPETNRCRGISTENKGSDIPFAVTPVAASSTTRIGWIIASLAFVGALGYGAYEWHQEIGRFLKKFVPAKTGKK